MNNKDVARVEIETQRAPLARGEIVRVEIDTKRAKLDLDALVRRYRAHTHVGGYPLLLPGLLPVVEPVVERVIDPEREMRARNLMTVRPFLCDFND
ncbi:hypothetical protein [Paraburkholderia sp. EG304]|uniref:hypothetical protein n=1 Tax=Paraburkholderia sp. EG304 TaxID=3237015 RepID=UPI00397CDC78